MKGSDLLIGEATADKYFKAYELPPEIIKALKGFAIKKMSKLDSVVHVVIADQPVYKKEFEKLVKIKQFRFLTPTPAKELSLVFDLDK